MDKRTSFNHPYNIINIKDNLFIGMAPGKKDTKWDRNIDIDLDVIYNEGIDIIICLLENYEMHNLDLAHYPEKVKDHGIIFYHFPIRDGSIPKKKYINFISYHLLLGHNVLIHCKCGLGRAGTMAACLLKKVGFDADEAITYIRSKREGAIQTKRQEKYILNY
jgi:ADP-ribosyl-[dinitrogen reductase] hydrolase